jgi:aminopeptidase-like protein
MVYPLSQDAIDFQATGEEIYQFITELYPICRSITGDGLRKTLDMIKKKVPIKTQEIPTGTTVFDWTVPKEWNIQDAYVKDSNGRRVIDYNQSNLHVVGYSVPIRRNVTREELLDHIFTIPEQPEWIPYRHTYHKEDWGFCIAHKTIADLQDDEYEVRIDSSLENGFLTLGEFFLQGETDDEVVIYTHTCHPSLCNDNLTGIGIATFLADWLRAAPRHYSYRFLFSPSTIGSITWLALHEAEVHKIKYGLILTGLGDSSGFTYKKSRKGDSEIDRAVTHVLRTSDKAYQILEFSPFGYDERQFCSPGFNLSFGCLMRKPNGKYPEYHTSGDDLDFISPENLGESLRTCIDIIELLECNKTYLNTNPKCEPQLGMRGLFRTAGRKHQPPEEQFALLWVLNLSDGSHSLLDIADRSRIGFDLLKKAANKLIRCGLLQEGQEKDL